MSLLGFWDKFIAPLLGGMPPTGAFRLMCSGRVLEISADVTLADSRVQPLATLELVGRLPSQGFSRLHQLMEHLLEALAPASTVGSKAPADDATGTSAREPIMHAIDSQIADIRAEGRAPHSSCSCCCCMSCTMRPSSTLHICGALLHSTDAAVVNITFRVVLLLLRARADCARPPVYFHEQSGALTLYGEDEQSNALYRVVQAALTPEGVAIASLLTLKQVH